MVDSKGEPEFWWFNTKTKKAEFGRKAHAINRLGPFDTEADALRALEIIAKRSKAWATEEENRD